MKLVLAANTSWYLWNFRRGLIKAYLTRGDHVILVCPDSEMTSRLAEMGCEIRYLKMPSKTTNPISDLRIFIGFWVLLASERPDVFLAFTIKPFVYGSLAARIVGARNIGTVTGLGTAFIHNNWVTVVARLLYRGSGKTMEYVFFQNPLDLEFFVSEKLVAKHKTVLVPGSGVDLERFDKRPMNRSRSLEAPVFLFIGRILWDKGLQELIDSARQLKKTIPDAQIQIAGKAEVDNATAVGEVQLTKWIQEGVVEYLGFHEDPRTLIENADCIVLPSYREGLPRSLLEGAAMGRPLLASDCVGCTEVVVDGVNGFIFRKKSAQSLLEAMERFIALSFSERQQFGNAARALAEKKFDQKMVFERYLAMTV